MAKTVFILGAGASKSAGAPVMENFVDVALSLRESVAGHITGKAFDALYSLLQERLPLLHSKSHVNFEHIEQLFGLLEMGTLVGRLPNSGAAELAEIAKAMRRVLAETVEQTVLFRRSPKKQLIPTEAYGSLAYELASAREKGGDPSWAFITFNYDLALDFVLHWNDLEIDYGFESTVSAAVPLLKLHGSVN